MLKILFQGDSVTDCGRDRDCETSLGTGYASKVALVCDTLFPEKQLQFVNRGVSGDRVCNLLERYEEDFLKVQPDVVSILIGINNTWRRYDANDGTELEKFRAEYELLLSKIKKDMPNTKIIIIEPFLMNSVEERMLWREDLNPKIMAIRELARTYADAYIALDGILQQYVIDGYSDGEIAEDAVHPSDLGHSFMARAYIQNLKKMGIVG